MLDRRGKLNFSLMLACVHLLGIALIVGHQTGNILANGFLFSADETPETTGDSATQEAVEGAEVAEIERPTPSGRNPRRILVFGGNGFIGAETVERLVRLGEHVTIVNRGNWYWDSKERIAPRVKVISCDRKNGVRSCNDLVQLVKDVEKFHAVIDFSAYSRREIADAIALLTLDGKLPTSKTDVYIQISTDSVYDVCDPNHRPPTGQILEDDAVRPSDPELRDSLAAHHEYGNGKLEAEEELVKQRNSPASDDDVRSSGIPYVILRLPDVLGPRDTTYRFWFYQLWIRVAASLSRYPVVVPNFLVGYNNSFVYVDDVAGTIVDIVNRVASESSSSFIDEAFNLAWPQNITLDALLRTIESALRSDSDDGNEKLEFSSDGNDNLYLYPTVRRGPIDSSKAAAVLEWHPTDWESAIKSTVEFYEAAMKDNGAKWRTQRDEIIQVVASQLYAGGDREEFYLAVEKLYNIDLAHFRPRKDEL